MSLHLHFAYPASREPRPKISEFVLGVLTVLTCVIVFAVTIYWLVKLR